MKHFNEHDLHRKSNGRINLKKNVVPSLHLSLSGSSSLSNQSESLQLSIPSTSNEFPRTN